MNTFLSKVENVLLDLAKEVAPLGSEDKAVVHQWAHAIAFDKDIYCPASRAEEKEKIRKKIVETLEKNGLFFNRNDFLNSLSDELKIRPESKARRIPFFA